MKYSPRSSVGLERLTVISAVIRRSLVRLMVGRRVFLFLDPFLSLVEALPDLDYFFDDTHTGLLCTPLMQGTLVLQSDAKPRRAMYKLRYAPRSCFTLFSVGEMQKRKKGLARNRTGVAGRH
jgi:hypothetical protein